MKKTPLYYLTAFISGMAVMSVELSASRLLAPYFGNSLYVWTNVIGLIMLALALGYFFGGRLADKHPDEKLYFTLVLITAIWVLIIPFVSPYLFSALVFGLPTLSTLVVWGSFFSVFLLLIVPMFFLGMMVPFTVKLVTDKLKKVGTYSGQVSLASTGGSLIGTFLPAFVLIPSFGTTRTFIMIGLVLFFLAAIGLRKYWLYILGILAVSLFWIVPPVFADDTMIYSAESPYGFIFVTENDEGVRGLQIHNDFGMQSVYDPNNLLTRYYYSYFGVLPAMLEEAEDVLVLGHASGSFTRIYNHYYPDLEITGVELDPLVTEISEEYMGLAGLDVEIVHGDARSYLRTNEEEYDLILVDTYQLFSIPPHLSTVEFFELAKSKIAEDGMLAMNVAAVDSDFLDALKNSVAGVFEYSYSVSLPNSSNSIFLAWDEGNFEMTDLSEDLLTRAQYIQDYSKPISYYPDEVYFEDDNLSLVELLSEEMIMKMLSRY